MLILHSQYPLSLVTSNRVGITIDLATLSNRGVLAPYYLVPTLTRMVQRLN